MIARLNRISDDSLNVTTTSTPQGEEELTGTGKTKIDYSDIRQEENPCSDPSTLDQLDIDQKEDLKSGIKQVLQDSSDNDLPDDIKNDLRQFLTTKFDVFWTSFSAGPPAKVSSLNIELTSDTKPTCFRLRNYSQEQHQFLCHFVELLLSVGMAYFSSSAFWVCASLLARKLAQYSFNSLSIYVLSTASPWSISSRCLILNKILRMMIVVSLFRHNRFIPWPLAAPFSQIVTRISVVHKPDGIFSHTRVLHGMTNAFIYIQATLDALMPEKLRQNILWWLDDSHPLEDGNRPLQFCLDILFVSH